jgi:hypothetical protein
VDLITLGAMMGGDDGHWEEDRQSISDAIVTVVVSRQ